MARLRFVYAPALTGLTVFGLSAAAGAQQLVRNTADIPTSTGSTENVDFADVDLDGDWDAVFADGGDAGNDQNKIWINAFNVGDPIGKFTNRTATQFPAVLDDSRDIEFVDYDSDGDFDIYVSNTSANSNQTNRWWNNMGSQAGTIGFEMHRNVLPGAFAVIFDADTKADRLCFSGDECGKIGAGDAEVFRELAADAEEGDLRLRLLFGE